ncbi:MAG: MerR family transcriptional regulator [Bacteroidota bacterium]|nr:MerR family transcriptional regulator [Bacteroidota bacterium]
MTTKNQDIPVYSIGTAARILGVSVQTLRLYESEGLIITTKSDGNQRIYSESDIERLRCIRKAINEDKISIGGMKQLHGMIPCWDIIKCSSEERSVCPAFSNHIGGCWTYAHEHSACSKRDCRLCEVYQRSSDCGYIKEQIKNITLVQHEQLLKQPLVNNQDTVGVVL